MRISSVIAGLSLVLYQPSFLLGTVSGQSGLTTLISKVDGVIAELQLDRETLDNTPKELKAANGNTPTTDSKNKETGHNGVQLQAKLTDHGSVLEHLRSEVTDIKVSISTNEQSITGLLFGMTQVWNGVKDILLGVEQQITELRQQNAILEGKYAKSMSLHKLVEENTENLSGLSAQLGTVNQTFYRVSGSLQELSKNVSDQKETYMTAIQDAVDQREKCQSGDGVGPSTYKPPPIYPAEVTVKFNPAFKKRPEIVYGLKTLDSSKKANVRMNATIVELTNEHFKLRISKWADTEMYRAVFSWMACPT